jgi:1-acyl-sn-glycerol-3-phosphate acyltransferase
MRSLRTYDERMKRRAREPIYSSAVGIGLSVFRSWRLKRIETGLENIPATGGAVFAMTHFGYLEFALVEWSTWVHTKRRIRFMARQNEFEKPLIGWLLRGMHHISVDMKAGAAAFGNAITALRSGELVGVFPEAGVNSSFTVRELKTGAVRMAAEAGVPIIPVAVWGGHRLLTKGRKIGFRERFGVPVCFAYGEPMIVTAADDASASTSQLRDRLQRLVDSVQAAYPVDGTGKWWQPKHLGGSAPTPEEAAVAEAERVARREAEEAERSASA